MRTVRGQSVGGLAVLSQSVWGQRWYCWHHAFLSVHLTALGGRARRPEEEWRSKIMEVTFTAAAHMFRLFYSLHNTHLFSSVKLEIGLFSCIKSRIKIITLCVYNLPIIRSFGQTSYAETWWSERACLCVHITANIQTFPAVPWDNKLDVN